MTLLHDKTVLDRRRNTAFRTSSSMLSKRLSYVLLGAFLGVVGTIVMFVFQSGYEDGLTKEKLQKAVNKAKKKGVVIKNINYKSANENADVSAKTAVQTQDKITLYTVNIAVADGAYIKADTAEIEKKSGIIEASGAVEYKQKKGIKIIAKNIKIDSNKSVLTGYGDIVATDEKIKIKGGSFNYNSNKKLLKVINKVIVEIKE